MQTEPSFPSQYQLTGFLVLAIFAVAGIVLTCVGLALIPYSLGAAVSLVGLSALMLCVLGALTVRACRS